MGDELLRRDRGGGVARDRGQERAAPQPARLQWRAPGGTHRRAPRLVAQQGDLAEAVPRSELPDELPVLEDLRTTGPHDVEEVPRLALAEDRLPRLDRRVLQRRGELLDGGHRQAAEHGDDAQELDVGVADAHVGVQPPERRPGEDDRERCEQADRHERRAQAEPVDDERRRQTAGRDPEREDGLEAGEHPREDRLVGEAAEQREAGDVDEGVAHADDAEEHERRGLLGDGADEDQRRAEQRHAEPEPRREPPAADQPEREQRAEHPARPDRRGEHADARVARSEQVDGHGHRQHAEAAAGERLHEAEPGDQRQSAIAEDEPEALEEPVGARAGRARRGVVREPDHRQGPDQRGDRARGEGGRRTGERQQERRDGGPGQRRPRVEQAADGVRAGQLLRRGAQRGQEGAVRGPERRERDRGHDGQGVDQDDGTVDEGQARDAPERRDPGEPDDDEHPLATDPVGDGSQPGSDQGRRRHPDGRDDTHRRDAALPEDEHGEGDHEGALAPPDRPEGDLRAPDRREASPAGGAPVLSVRRSTRDRPDSARTSDAITRDPGPLVVVATRARRPPSASPAGRERRSRTSAAAWFPLSDRFRTKRCAPMPVLGR
ncbi:MAG: hypothetical protein AVDCRST_MAG13-1244 [uncultured Solirubrobacteraceae bacterium]|uniref:Uncharacterized protein n=1 Tax=uncultured Solirubrobacteraceae bacterium TaxID=1162706 RepID=A0A6J4S1A6_9ACTN|nr:MAG: hypothetical protein AVDCRST_MAG13-1244 [uncultured Solirubrobacteraceae bacterium]